MGKNGENYFTWRKNFLNVLHSKNKLSRFCEWIDQEARRFIPEFSIKHGLNATQLFSHDLLMRSARSSKAQLSSLILQRNQGMIYKNVIQKWLLLECINRDMPSHFGNQREILYCPITGSNGKWNPSTWKKQYLGLVNTSPRETSNWFLVDV